MKISTQKSAQKDTDFSIISKVGIFAASLLITASAVYIYSPVNKSNAAMNGVVGGVISPVVSVTLSAEDVDVPITPNGDETFGSNSITATVSTNSVKGYDLYFSSIDDTTDMINMFASSTISSDFSGTVTSSSMGVNKWGYSLNNTDFSKIPTLSEQAKIKSIDHTPSTAEKATTVDFGVKVSSRTPSGVYTKNVLFSAVAHAMPSTLADISTMQEMNSYICNNTAVGATKTLTDIRDQNTYSVAKLADGRCWMTQDLRIMDTTISSADSNLPAGTSYTIPASSNPWGFEWTRYGERAYDDGVYGGHYNLNTAFALWKGSGNSPQDICPRNWRMPTYDGDFKGLFDAYADNRSELTDGTPNLQRSGYMSGGSYYSAGNNGMYWSSSSSGVVSSSIEGTVYTGIGGDQIVWVYSNSASMNGTYPSEYGASIRCVVK